MKILLLLIAIGLIGVVLYVGYKMDKGEEQKERKARYKTLYNSETEEKVSSIYGTRSKKVSANGLETIKRKIQDRVGDLEDAIDEKRKERVENKLRKIERKFKANASIPDIIDDNFEPNNDESWEMIDEDLLIERMVEDEDI